MKITSIDVMLITTGQPARIGDAWNPTVVRINTDEGISGYGEVGLVYGKAKDSGYGIAQDFAKMIIGMDPMDNEAIWEKLYRGNFWSMGNGGVIMGGFSAIDMACWDIRGKKLGVPCYKLLGGKLHPKIRAYASQIQFDWSMESKNLIHPSEYAEATLKAKADGFNAVKVDPVGFNEDGVWRGTQLTGMLSNGYLKLVKDRVRAIREAGGDDMDIIIELHSITDTNTSIQVARELEEFGIYYMEEPTAPLNPGNMKVISEKSNIPLASGERIYTRWGYRPFFENHSLRVIQPDLGNCGGLTEGKKICDMAYVYDVAVQLHVCGGPIATAAALHLEAAMPNFLIHEHHRGTMIEANIKTGRYDYQPVNGYFTVPELPGIGQELSDHAIKHAIVTTIK